MSYGDRCQCHSCTLRHAVGAQLTGTQRNNLHELRERLTKGLANRELRPMAGELDSEGTLRFVPCTFKESVDRLVAKREFEWAIGEVD